jgi:hypothetical protein
MALVWLFDPPDLVETEDNFVPMEFEQHKWSKTNVVLIRELIFL